MYGPARVLGVESCHGFGDSLMNVSFLEAISAKIGSKIGVAVKASCRDAFYNVSCVDEIITIPGFHDGKRAFQSRNYKDSIQITQNHWFPEFKRRDDQHSLLDTASLTALELGYGVIDRRPKFIPTEQELAKTASFIFPPGPILAIEDAYNSGQSWSGASQTLAILEKYKRTHKIIWLSNSTAPNDPAIIDLSGWTRRELIVALRRVDLFFSVGSGFFIATLALEKQYQPKKVACLWIDEYYRYERRLAELQWHSDITWLHNNQELQSYLGQ